MSQRDRPRVLWHRVPHSTLCPLGKPEIAIGHEPRIEPWLPVSTSLLAALSKLDGMVTISRETHENEQQANLLQGSETTVGWISRNSLHSGRGGAFFLDIPFYRTQ